MDHADNSLPAPPDSSCEVLREVAHLAVPMIVGYASSTAMHFVDALMVSKVGDAEMAAVGASGVIVFALTALAMGGISCVNTFASQSLGRGELRQCSAYGWQSVFLSLLVGVVSIALIPTLSPIFRWIGHDADVQACELVYGRIRLMGMGFMVAAWGLCSYFQGIHRPWVSTATTLVANVVNVAANYALIFGHFGMPRLGVAGAAYGTMIACAFQWLLLVGFMVHPWHARVFGGRDTLRVDWPKLRQLVHIGWPAGLNFALDIASWAIFTNLFVGRFGRAALAGNFVAVQYMHLSFMPALGLSHATAALVGRYIGRQDIPRAKQRAYMAMRVTVVYMLVMGAIFFCFRFTLVRWFNDDPEVVRHAAVILIFAAVFQGVDALGIISSGALRGAGDTHWTAMATIGCCWGVFVPIGWTLSRFAPGLGPKGPWIGATAYICLLGLLLFWRFRSEGWTQIEIFRERTGPHVESQAGPAE